jgi:hypothetical protein
MVRYEDVRIMVQAGLTSNKHQAGLSQQSCAPSPFVPVFRTYLRILPCGQAYLLARRMASAAASPSQRRRGGPLEAAGEGSEGKGELEAFALFRRLLCRCATVWPS